MSLYEVLNSYETTHKKCLVNSFCVAIREHFVISIKMFDKNLPALCDAHSRESQSPDSGVHNADVFCIMNKET